MIPLAMAQAGNTASTWLVLADGTLGYTEALSRASDWADYLPDAKYMVLLCEQRSHFILGFIAGQLKGITVLLPPNRAPGVIREVLSDYPDSFCLADDVLPQINAEVLNCHDFPIDRPIRPVEVAISSKHIATIVFTSGSTGKARPNPKTWGSLVHGARLAMRRFAFGPDHCIVATVPPQHMYGLETSVMLPLRSGARVHGGRPFYPEDIRLALARCPGRRVLVTTPIHLRACIRARLAWPQMEQIISATAPLDKTLAAMAETQFRAPVREIYGCTEAGALASRHTLQNEDWQLYDDFRISLRDRHCYVMADHLDEKVKLADVIRITGQNHFQLLGRHSDLINLAGKRGSLSDLNSRLNAVPGVLDGAFFDPDPPTGTTHRLAALVVAPNTVEARILAALADHIDPVFLPRPLLKVSALPRNATGKLPRDSLLNFFEQQVTGK